MSRHFTPSQQQAVDHQGHNILVSASAGSGKTTVLVERVIQKILHGTDVSDLLVVTFTEAAASEMRQRIEIALKDAMRVTDDATLRQTLRTQINLLASAHISTLHAFCLDVIRHYYYLIDLDPDFRLLTDDTEGILLRETVWDDVREATYATDNETFERLVANFSNDRSDDGLTNVVMNLFNFANANPDPTSWLQGLTANYQFDSDHITDSTLFKTKIAPAVKLVIQTQIGKLTAEKTQLEEFMKDGPVEILTADIVQLQTRLDELETASWNTIRTDLGTLVWDRWKSGPKGQEADRVQQISGAKITRDTAKKAVNGLLDQYFVVDEAQTKQAVQQSAVLVDCLAKIVQTFTDAYNQEKRRRHVLDFSDLEHLCLAILTNESDQAQAVVAGMKAQFTEIMVDEYQDTNQLQETILTAITNDHPGNMFMVGDVKQSIYQFRLADPSLFLGKYQQYHEDPTNGERIVLAENFRSLNGITNFTNLLFEQLMDQRVGQMDYDDDAHLKFGATYYPTELTKPTEIMIFESNQESETEDDAVDEAFDVDGSADGQVLMTAKRIKQMIDRHEEIFDRKTQQMRAIEYRDIVLLAPTRKNHNLIVERFKATGIPVVVNDAQNYFRATEIRIMMALLQIIDNPYQDIPLVAVLRSPIVGFDENQLAYLRINDKTGDYYQAVMHFMKQGTPNLDDQYAVTIYDKLAKFLDQLDQFRDLANHNQLVDLIWTIYQETGFLDYVGGMPGGAQRQANLHALYDRAHVYEESSFKGLFQFVHFIKLMQDRQKDLGQVSVQTTENAVSVMTIHGSKGLEFPIVFLLDATHRFNRMDSRGNAVFDETEGIGISYLSSERVMIPTLQRQMAIDAKQNKEQAEQLRVLYVALTRAEQQLVIVGAYKDAKSAIKKWSQATQSDGRLLPEGIRLTTDNFMDLIGMSLYRHPQFLQIDVPDDVILPEKLHSFFDSDQTQFNIQFYGQADLQITSGDADVEPSTASQLMTEQLSQTNPTELNVDHLDEVLNFVYPHTAATRTTAYQSVSEVKRIFEDPDSRDLNKLAVTPDSRAAQGRYVQREFAKPKFMTPLSAPQPTQIGTATHLVLQELSLETKPTKAVINQLIVRLVQTKVITEAIGVKIKQTELLELFESPFGQALIAHQDNIQREVPFSMLMPAKTLFDGVNDEKPILIHGIVDGYYIEQGAIHLFDYKTDFVEHGNQAGIEKLVSRYRGQLNLYAAAIAQFTNLPVASKQLYLLSINQAVQVE